MPSGFIVEDEFSDAAKMLVDLYPKEVKSFLRREGNKLKKITIEKAKAVVDEHTGKYFKGIKRGKYYKHRETGADSIRVYAGTPAFHGHLIEYGHEMITRSGRNVGFVRGYRIFHAAADQFESVYETDSEKFANKIMTGLD